MSDSLFRVESIFAIPGRGTVLAGRVAAKRIEIGQRLIAQSPANAVRFRVHGIERHHAQLSFASCGEEVGLFSRDLDLRRLPDGVVREEGFVYRVLDLRIVAAPRPWWMFW